MDVTKEVPIEEQKKAPVGEQKTVKLVQLPDGFDGNRWLGALNRQLAPNHRPLCKPRYRVMAQVPLRTSK